MVDDLRRHSTHPPHPFPPFPPIPPFPPFPPFSHTETRTQMFSPDLLDVVSVYDNPLRWHSRLANFKRFEDGIVSAGVRLRTVELAHGKRDFELPDREGVTRIRLRANDVLWRKENLMRIGAADSHADYLMFSDGDMLIHGHDWADHVMHALQLRRLVQIGTDLIWLGPKDRFAGSGKSLMYWYERSRRRHREGKFWETGPVEMVDWGFPGGIWAYRRDAYDKVGLLDICPLGAADYHSIYAILGLPDLLLSDNDYTVEYRQAIRDWGSTASAAIAEADVGFVDGIIYHLWHGPLKARRYSTREQILIRNKFNPNTDLVRRRDGLVELSGNKPKLAGDILAYFSERNEDSVDM